MVKDRNVGMIGVGPVPVRIARGRYIELVEDVDYILGYVHRIYHFVK